MTSVLIAVVLALAALSPGQAAPPFELVEGDRVVFVGSGWVEAAQEHGYVELALTTRWPDRNVTFRNLGWSGDTVRGEARGHYTNPPGPYEHLIDQITTARPTVVFVGYGSHLAFDASDAARADFLTGLTDLLAQVKEKTGARIVLVSPPPQEAEASPIPPEQTARHNDNLRRAAKLLSETARAEDAYFVDLFAGLSGTDARITTDGLHLNADGYRLAAEVVERALGLPPRAWGVAVDAATGRVVTTGPAEAEADVDARGGAVTIRPRHLPLPDAADRLTVAGLGRGDYALAAGGSVLHAAPAAAWARGVTLGERPDAARAEALRRLIVRKNALYFRQYRPQNETYLVGFRRYEQGQNADELDQLAPLIDELELEIGRLRTPPPLRLTLSQTSR